MMNAGGYAVASELMGIDLNSRTLKTREYYERMNPSVGMKREELDGFLTLGRQVLRTPDISCEHVLFLQYNTYQVPYIYLVACRPFG